MTERFDPSAALVAYAEPLLAGKRVFAVGDATSDLAERLLDRGARIVHLCDTDPSRVAEATTRNASRNLSFAPLPDSTAAVRDGAFDLVLVTDLAALPEPEVAIKSARRAVGPQGVALIASPNSETKTRLLPASGTDALDYYDLYDLVSGHFEEVVMFGQSPFVGYAVASFAPEGEFDPAIDTGFLPSGAEEPEWFVAVASVRPAELDEYMVVQLPYRTALGPAKQEAGERRAAEKAERKARERITALETALDESKKQNEQSARRSRDAEELRRELADRDSWIKQLEARADAADARADEVEKALKKVRSEPDKRAPERARRDRDPDRDRDRNRVSELETLIEKKDRALEDFEARLEKKERLLREAQVEKKDRALEDLEARLAKKDRALEDFEARLEKKERLLREAQAKTRELRDELRGERTRSERTAEDDSAAADVERLEQLLLERGERIRELERDVREAERVGRELLSQSKHEDEEPNGDLAAKLDDLARRNAEREADLEAAQWTIQELEGSLAAGATDEALGEQLVRARAEVQRQATLIEQLKARQSSRSAR